MGKDFIALGRMCPGSIMRCLPPCRLVGIDDIEVAIHDRDTVSQSASELFDGFKTSRKDRIVEDRGCWLFRLRPGHLDLLS
jgi:hypothetical protein